MKLAPCSHLALSFPSVICSSEQHCDLTCIHACALKEYCGLEGIIFASFKTASQFPTNMVDYGVCNVPSLDSEQSPGSTRIEKPLAGGLEKAAGTIKAQTNQRQGSDCFLRACTSSMKPELSPGGWRLRLHSEAPLPTPVAAEGCCASPWYFWQGFEHLWDLGGTVNMPAISALRMLGIRV